MYDLGEHFKPNYELAIPNKDSIIIGQKYRITILTDSLFRFEYSESGVFNDKPTELVWYRNLPKPTFEVKQDNKYLEIKTKYARILYTKEKHFYGGKVNPSANLSVKLLENEKIWYYQHPEVRNIGSPGYQIDNKNIKNIKKLSDLKLDKGLFSFDGFVTLDDSTSKIIHEDGTLLDKTEKTIDVYLIVYGKDFERGLKDYYKITGYPALIPRYALGNWWFKNEDYNTNSLREVMENFWVNRIPISVITLNHHWHKLVEEKKKEKIYSGFTFDNKQIEDPVSLINYMHSLGIHLGLNINPFQGLYPIDDNYEQAKEYLKTDSNGVIPFNVYDPKTLDVFFKLYLHPLEAAGTDFFFIDYFDEKNKTDLSYYKHYGYIDMTRNYKKRPMMLSYNTPLAPHRYSVLTSPPTTVGWDGLKLLALYNSSMSNNGINWWSHDIGGYTKGVEDSELYTRFIQAGVFSPILKLSADQGKYYKREPWRWNIKTFTITKEYLTLRHKLIPYIYSEAYKYSKEGNLLIKPLYYAKPELYDDELYYNEYFFGSQMFVSPIIDKKDEVMNRTIHHFYIPDGIWYNFFDGKKFPGPNTYVSFFRDQDYPVFAKAGSIIPMGLNRNMNDTNPPVDMELHIFPGVSNTYHLYEDDGVSDLHKKDFYLLTDIDYNYMPNNYTVIIRSISGKSGIVPDHRNYKIIFRNTKKAEDVSVHSNDLSMEYTSYVKGPDFVVEIQNAKTIGQITINCKGKDIETDAVRIINKDIEQILSDLEIPTELKEKIDEVIFSDLPVNKKRIGIRHLKSKGLEPKFMKLFLKLLEYIKQV